MNDSFLPYAIQALAERKGKKGGLAKYMSKLVDEHGLEEALFVAFANAQVSEPEYIPIQILGYAQDLMDKVCWSARRLIVVSQLPEEVYGCDPTQNAREDIGVSAEPQHIPELVDADFKTLYSTLAIMQQMLPELVFELHYFNPSELIDGQWVEKRTCDSFGDAEIQMQEIVEYLDQTKPITMLQQMRELAAKAAEAA